MSRLGTPHLLDSEGLPLFSLKDVNALRRSDKERVYAELVPAALFERFGIDRQSFRGSDGLTKVNIIAPEGLGLMRIEIRLHPDDRDCLFFVELADTPYGQMELSFCIVNDPSSPRFDIDRDEEGKDNVFGTLRRNLPEEIRAMEAGLAPHQVRFGLGLFSPFFASLERLADGLGIDTIVAEPLSYCNAVRYERYGFDYIQGKQLMLWIDREFRPGGELQRRLDVSTPFRRPGMEASVRGRSWAIHDGILGRPWDGVKIYNTLGVEAGLQTFTGQCY